MNKAIATTLVLIFVTYVSSESDIDKRTYLDGYKVDDYIDAQSKIQQNDLMKFQTTLDNTKKIMGKDVKTMKELIKKLESPKDMEEYQKYSYIWAQVAQEYSKGKGCTPPMPPIQIHRTVSATERTCNRGHKFGYQNASKWINVILRDHPKDKDGNLSDDELNLLRSKFDFFSKCLVNLHMKGANTFSMCYKQGIYKAKEEYIDDYNEHTNKFDEATKEEDLMERIMVDYKSKYADYIDKAYNVSECSKYKPYRTSHCAGPKSTKYYCVNHYAPTCVPGRNDKKNYGYCARVYDTVVPINKWESRDDKTGKSKLCTCPTGSAYWSECSESTCTKNPQTHCYLGKLSGSIMNSADTPMGGSHVECADKIHQQFRSRFSMYKDDVLEYFDSFSFRNIPFECQIWQKQDNFKKNTQALDLAYNATTKVINEYV